MGTQVIMNRPLWLAQLDVSNIGHAIALSHEAEAADDTRLIHDTRNNTGGLPMTGFSLDVYNDFDTYDAELFTDLSDDSPMTVATEGGTEQELAFILLARHMTHEPISGAVGDVNGGNVSGGSSSRLVRGRLELNRAAGASVNSSGYQLGALDSGETLVANLHVTAAAGTTMDIDIESDDNAGFTTATTRGSFTQVTGLTSEQIRVSGPVSDDYWRASVTIVGGSFTLALSFGIEPAS